MSITETQKAICTEYGAGYIPSPSHLKLGISKNVKDGIIPVNGLRHEPERETSGWFIWAGEEFSDKADFFIPIHIKHIQEWSTLILPFLGLAPGWRFLVTHDYTDVWFDHALLKDSK